MNGWRCVVAVYVVVAIAALVALWSVRAAPSPATADRLPAPAGIDLAGYWSCEGTVKGDEGDTEYDTIVKVEPLGKGYWRLTWYDGSVQHGVGVVRGNYCDVAIAFPSGAAGLCRYELGDKKLSGRWQATVASGTETLTFLRGLKK